MINIKKHSLKGTKQKVHKKSHKNMGRDLISLKLLSVQVYINVIKLTDHLFLKFLRELLLRVTALILKRTNRCSSW